MGTVARFRNPSGIQFIDTMKDLANHTIFYINRLPKSTRFIWQTKICELVQDALIHVAKANSVFVKYESDYTYRRRLLQSAMGNIDALEIYLATLATGGYYNSIAKGEDFPFLKWGELIDRERSLIKKVMTKDEEAFKKISG